MRLVKKSWALLLILTMIPGLGGCSNLQGLQNGGSAESVTNFLSDIQKETDLNVMLETPVLTLDPQLATDGASFEVIANFMDGLMQMDAAGQTVNALCQSYQVSEDGLLYTFKIREDAYWSNGEPVTAADFVFAWRRAVDPENASEYAYIISDIGQIKNAAQIIAGEMDVNELGVAALDDKNLVVELNIPVSYFTSLLYFPLFYPVNEEFYNSCQGEFGNSPETVLSNGAFVLDAYEPGATAFHLSKNEDYYGAKKVKLSGIAYQVIQDSQLALLCYERGSLDVALLNGAQAAQVKTDENALEFQAVSTGIQWYVTPNQEVPELANRNIRMALTMAIDREFITKKVLQDGSETAYSVVPPKFATGPAGEDFVESLKAYEEVCAHNPQKALEYWKMGLNELGLGEGETKPESLEPVESVLTLKLLVDADDAPQKVAEALKIQWEETLPGLKIELVAEAKAKRVEAMENGEFQLGLTRWGPDYMDPVTYLSVYMTENSNNYGFWSKEKYDKIIEACVVGDLRTDEKKRWKSLHEAEQLLMEDAVIFPLYTQCNAQLVGSNVKGIQFHPLAVNRVYKRAVKTME